MHFYLWIFLGIFYKDLRYDILKQKEHRYKKIVRKTLTQKQKIFLNFLKWILFSNVPLRDTTQKEKENT
jgi:hypothetical protein